MAYERPEALAALMVALERGPDPGRSPRVAQAVRRVVARDLEHVVLDDLRGHGSLFWNAACAPRRARRSVARTAVLAEALVHVRGDQRSWWLLGNARFAARSHTHAAAAFQRALELDPRRSQRGALLSNLAAAAEYGGDLGNALTHYRSADRLDDPLAPLFGCFVAIRAGEHASREWFVGRLKERWDVALESAVSAVGRMHARRSPERGLAFAQCREELRREGAFGAHVADLLEERT